MTTSTPSDSATRRAAHASVHTAPGDRNLLLAVHQLEVPRGPLHHHHGLEGVVLRAVPPDVIEQRPHLVRAPPVAALVCCRPAYVIASGAAKLIAPGAAKLIVPGRPK